MFGVSVVIIFLLISLLITWRHGQFNLGQIVYGMFMGLLLAAVAPTMASSSLTFINAIGKALMAIKWG